jgi:hypothetical protein
VNGYHFAGGETHHRRRAVREICGGTTGKLLMEPVALSDRHGHRPRDPGGS